jgi:hypothetical protein
MYTRLSYSSSRPEDAILARIRRVAAWSFQCNVEKVDAATSADDVDGWDSLSHPVQAFFRLRGLWRLRGCNAGGRNRQVLDQTDERLRHLEMGE